MDWAELQNWNEYTKLLIGLLALADPLGVQPMLLTLTKDCTGEEKKKIALVAVITFVVTLLIFTYLGIQILDLFGISVAALKIAGGILFLFYALEMMGLIQLPSSQKEKTNSTQPKSIGIVPVGIPLLAGPGTISAIIIYADMHAEIEHKILVNAVILSAGVAIYVLFRVGLSMGDRLGETATAVMNRVMGLILGAISIEFILDGIVAHFPEIVSIH